MAAATLLLVFACLAAAYGLQTGEMVEVEIVKEVKAPAAKSSVYQNNYCQKPGMVCTKGQIMKETFSPTTRICLTRCNRIQNCVTFHMDEDKICTLRDGRCTEDELVPGDGTDYYRLKKGETCPADRPLYVKPPIRYSDRYCVMREKQCKGYNLYPKPQNTRPWLNCLKKCSNIVTCASADFVNDRCILNDYHCPDEELDDAGPMDLNFMRMPLGVLSCPSNRMTPEALSALLGGQSENQENENVQNENVISDKETCAKEECLCPCNSDRNDAGHCQCKAGFEIINGQCALGCPVGGERQADGACQCVTGMDSIGLECLPACPASTKRNGRACTPE